MKAAIVGGGPAGLMAAEVLSRAGARVTVYEQKPSLGRKFLMAGKSGLNLTKDEPASVLVSAYDRPEMIRMVQEFDAQAVMAWAKTLGQDLFTGTTGRVFPVAMKASPLLRAWLARLEGLGVRFATRHRWVGWDRDEMIFNTADGQIRDDSSAQVLTLGGGSWARLGSDGAWQSTMSDAAIETLPFEPSNAALTVAWSEHMRPFFGQPLKSVAWHAGPTISRGEAILSEKGLEGGGIYSLSRTLRREPVLSVDLLPDLDATEVFARLSRPMGKSSLANHLRKTTGLPPIKLALLQEWGRPLPKAPDALAQLIKALPVSYAGFRPLDEAISTVGGFALSGLDETLMIPNKPGVFVAGEMLDWDAPTGGYLITGCLASGRWAGLGAARWLDLQPDAARL